MWSGWQESSGMMTIITNRDRHFFLQVSEKAVSYLGEGCKVSFAPYIEPHPSFLRPGTAAFSGSVAGARLNAHS